MSALQDHFFGREIRALTAIALVLVVCAALLTIGLLLGGYTLVDLTSWFVRATGG
jgi:hypothetical protein